MGCNCYEDKKNDSTKGNLKDNIIISNDLNNKNKNKNKNNKIKDNKSKKKDNDVDKIRTLS